MGESLAKPAGLASGPPTQISYYFLKENLTTNFLSRFMTIFSMYLSVVVKNNSKFPMFQMRDV